MPLSFIPVPDVIIKFYKLISQYSFSIMKRCCYQLDGESLGLCHPNIWCLLNILKKQQNLTDIRINPFIVGQEPPK